MLLLALELPPVVALGLFMRWNSSISAFVAAPRFI
jgi:hypothetical protein